MQGETRCREAALLLHGLPPAARGQVLSKLSSEQRTAVQPLLEELSELGVPRQIVHHDDRAPRTAQASLKEQVAALDADTIARAIKPCSAATVAALLQAQQWPWSSALFAQLPATQQPLVAAMRRDSDACELPPAAIDALCERLMQELNATRHGARAASSARPAWRLLFASKTAGRLWKKVSAWTS